MTAASIGQDTVFVPMLPSLDNFFRQTEKGSKQAGDKAGKSFADAMTRSVEQAERRVGTASKAYERAQNRASDAADKTRVAEIKLEEAMESGNATASQVATRTAAVEKARRDQTAAENNAERASKDLTKAQGDLTKATQEQEDAVQASAEEMSKWALSAEEAEQASQDLENAQKALEVGIAATGAALVGAIAGLVSIGSGFHDMSRQIAISSGATGDDLRELEESAMSVATTVPVSFEESADALATLNTMTGEAGPHLEELTSQVLEASNLLGEDGVANADAFGSALRQWEVDAETGASAMDGLFSITQDYGIGLGEVTGHLNTYGSVLNNAGFEMEEAAVLFGSLDRAGLSVSRIMPGLNSAFRNWASEGENVQDMLAQTVGEIESAETAQEALALATDTFGAEGAQRLTTAIRNGSFELEDFQTALGNTEGAIADTAAENRTLEESFQLMKNEAMVAIEPLATELFESLIPAVERAGEALTDMIDWVSENEELVKGLVVAVAGMAAGLVAARASIIAFTTAKRAMNVATLLATGGFRALNAAMRANVFVLIATAIAGLVAGLVYFFTQTETGQEIWESFTSALGTAWDWVVEKLSAGWDWIKNSVFDPLMNFVTGTLQPIWESVMGFLSDSWDRLVSVISWAYENIFQPVFNAILTVAKVTIGVIATVVLAPLLTAWHLLSDGIAWAWENVIKPAWDALTSAATWMYENVLQPVFSFIGDAWNLLVTGIVWYWDNVLKVAWENLQTAATWMYENVLRPVFSWIGDRWTDLSNAIQWAWENIVRPAWDALGDALSWLYDTIIQPTLQWISDRWDDMSNALHAGYTWIKENVFDAVGSSLETVQGWFETAVDAVGRAWERLQELTAKPINFVIEYVYGGIKSAWDAVANLVDLPTLPEIQKIGGYAEGTSRVPGARTPHDNMHMISSDGRFSLSLRGDEGVVVPEVVDAFGERTIDDMNRLGLTQGASGVARYIEHLGSHAAGTPRIRRQTPFFGGAVSDIQRSQETFVERFFPNIFTLTSATRYTDSGYHSTGQATDWQDSGAQWPTPNSKALSRAIATNFPNTAELIHWPNDGWPNISQGQPYDFGPATNQQHANHVHWATQGPVRFDGDDIVLDDTGGGGVWESITSMAKRIWDGIIDMIPSYGDESDATGGLFGDLPGKFLTRTAGAAWDWIKEKADQVMSFFGSSGGGAEQWRDLSRIALSRHGYNPDQYIEQMLAQIEIESSGNPRAENLWDSNAIAGTPSGGLLQVIGPTYDRVRTAYPEAFEGLPDDRWNPLTNLTAGVGAVRMDWGGPGGRWPTTGGYHEGGLAPGGQGWLRKTALEPEMVLNPDMTKAFIEWMGATPQGESAAVVAKELAEAFHGGDWGYGELASYLGEDIAKATVDVVAAIGRADRGFREWAAASEEQGRMGTPEEWARHYGAQAGAEYGAEALGLLGLESLAGHTFRDSLVDLVNEAMPYGNQALADHDVDFRFGPMAADMWQPVAVIDSDGRVIGTVIEAEQDIPEDEPEDIEIDTDDVDLSPADAVASAALDVAREVESEQTPTTATAPGGAREIVLRVEGDAVSTATLKQIFDENRDELGDLKIRVEKVEGELDANVTSGITGIV